MKLIKQLFKRLFCEHHFEHAFTSKKNDCFKDKKYHINLTLRCTDCNKLKDIYYIEEE